MPVDSNYIGKDAVGFMVNTDISSETTAKIKLIQQHASDIFGNKLWITPSKSLHITLLDWLAPLVEYGEDKDTLFDTIQPTYDSTLRKVVKKYPLQYIIFDRILISPTAIILTATDAASTFNEMRSDFLSEISLLPNTKEPPTIVHTTIARFVDTYDPRHTEQFLQENTLSIGETINHFRLVRETKLPMLDYSVLETYKLGS